MNRSCLRWLAPFAIASLAWLVPSSISAQPPAEQCEELGAILEGRATAGNEVCRVSFPRDDLAVTLLGAVLPPDMGLTSWAAFADAGERGAVVAGDLALTSEELPAVVSGLRENDLRITAVHRHMMGESPGMSFVHYLGFGPAEELAAALRATLAGMPPTGGLPAGLEVEPPWESGREGVVAGVECGDLAGTLGVDPAAANTGPGYCKVSIPRADLDVAVEGMPVPAALGIGSWFAFRETTDGGEAVVTGDFALTEERVNDAVEPLQRAGIGIVAFHNHMLGEEPRVVFFHFQARGEPHELARGLRAGLEAAGLP